MDHLSKEEFLALIDKYNQGCPRPEEEEFLTAYFNLFELKDEFTDGLDLEAQIKLKSQLKRKIDQHIEEQESKPIKLKNKSSYLWTKFAAASVVLMFSFGLYFFSQKKQAQQAQVTIAQDRPPGDDKAVLILSNGQKINIDHINRAEIARQAGIKILKNADGNLVCYVEKTAANKSLASLYTVQTPMGGKYQVNLPDGTQVWLNAASSLKFPAQFEGKERRVELTGEGYFEVAKDKSKPFRVWSRNQVVEVLGTHFNINGYTDEKEVKTTLLEGAVELYNTAGKRPVLRLKPGQQAVNINGNMDLNPDPDVEGVMAWKKDTFQFEDADLGTIMRQLSRWYDVDIELKGTIPEQHYKGRISRNVPLSQVLEILKVSGVHFKVEGRKIIITP